jgi:hypothetical protein
MHFNREDMEGMNVPDLVAHANLTYGLGVNKDYQKHDLINMIEQSQRKFKGNAGIRVLNPDEEMEVPPGYMKVRIRPNKHDRIPRPAIIGHQFKVCSVPVNKDVIIPQKYLPCFEDAIIDVYFTDPATNEFVCQREHTYSYSILEMGAPLPNASNAVEELVGDDDMEDDEE